MISSLLTKASLSALIGSPIAYGLNIGVLPTFVELIEQNVFLASALIVVPFFVASTLRMFVIDYVYEKYHINLDPLYHVRKRLIRNKIK